MNQKNYTVQELSNFYKYTIWGKLQNFTNAEKINLKVYLPELIGVTWRTIENWMYIRKDNNKFVPADKLYLLSTFFECEVSEMWHTPPTPLTGELQKIKQHSIL